MKKIYITLIFFVSLTTNLFSQYYLPPEYQKHEVSVGLLGGIASLDSDIAGGTNSGKMTVGVVLDYTYFFNKKMGLLTGLDLMFYKSDLKLNNFSSSHDAFDIDLQKDFDFRYTLNNYKEEQDAFFINIPVMLHYEFYETEKIKFYADGGFKFGIPINGKYKAIGGDLTTTGYFPHDNSLWDKPTFRGFGDFDVREHDDEVNYKVSMNLALELGAKWALSSSLSLYTGLYLDYGLNDISESTKGDLPLVQYNQLNPEDHIYNGVLNSTYKTAGGSTENLINKVNTMAYGLKVRIAFGQ